MNNKVKIVTAFLCGAVFFSGISYAATGDIIAKPANFKVIVDGQEKKFNNKIVTIEGTTYLSIRDTAKAVNKDVSFSNGVIALSSTTEKDSSKSVAPTAETSSVENYKKLPLTVTKNNVTVTVNSISISDNSTDFSVVITNNNSNRTTIDYGGLIAVNKNVPGKTVETLGTIRTSDNFPTLIDGNSTVKGVIKKDKVDSNAENIMFYITVGRDIFDFYIDTKGDL